jgi:hypothetical protein
MIITKQFAYIHMPKTGGTFVTTVLKQIHEARSDHVIQRKADVPPSLRERLYWLLPGQSVFLMLTHPQPAGGYNQHGSARRIPPEHQHKIILTTMRSPYERYVSQYEFQWWKLYPKRRLNAECADEEYERLLAEYPHFPDLSFEEFLKVSNSYFLKRGHQGQSDDQAVGFMTERFVDFYYRDPEALKNIDDAYIAAKGWQNDLLPRIHFLRTETLNMDLYNFLKEMGYREQEIASLPNRGKIMPPRGGRTDDKKWQDYYTPELKQWVRQYERMLFAMFPEFEA